MTPAGWHPDPAGGPGRLRWWDGQAWTGHVHEQAPAAPAVAPVGGSPLEAPVVVFGPPGMATPGTRVFELTDAGGSRLGRMVETARGVNDSALGAALSRAKGLQHATTREVRGPRGYPELVLTWGPGGPEPRAAPDPGGPAPPATRLIVVTRPDRREVGRLVWAEATGDGRAGWALVGADGRRWGTAWPAGSVTADGRPLSQVAPDDGGGWRLAVQDGPHQDPLRSLVVAAAGAADVL